MMRLSKMGAGAARVGKIGGMKVLSVLGSTVGVEGSSDDAKAKAREAKEKLDAARAEREEALQHSRRAPRRLLVLGVAVTSVAAHRVGGG